MRVRPKLVDDMAGVAQGAFSAFLGLREEAEAAARAQFDEIRRRLDLARGEDIATLGEVASRARAGQEQLVEEIALLKGEIAALASRVATLEAAARSPSADAAHERTLPSNEE